MISSISSFFTHARNEGFWKSKNWGVRKIPLYCTLKQHHGWERSNSSIVQYIRRYIQIMERLIKVKKEAVKNSFDKNGCGTAIVCSKFSFSFSVYKMRHFLLNINAIYVQSVDYYLNKYFTQKLLISFVVKSIQAAEKDLVRSTITHKTHHQKFKISC